MIKLIWYDQFQLLKSSRKCAWSILSFASGDSNHTEYVYAILYKYTLKVEESGNRFRGLI